MKEKIAVMKLTGQWLKKRAGVFAAPVLFAAASSVQALTDPDSGLTYVISNSTAWITGGTVQSNAVLHIPETLDGVPVTHIGEEAFNAFDLAAGIVSVKGITGLSAPSVTHIGIDAFAGERKLASLYLPAAVSIGSSAFSSTALQTVSLPAAVSIGDSVFSQCSELRSASLPAASSIGDTVFDVCNNLRKVFLPSAANIGESTFWECQALEHLFLGGTPALGTWAFGNDQFGDSQPTNLTVHSYAVHAEYFTTNTSWTSQPAYSSIQFNSVAAPFETDEPALSFTAQTDGTTGARLSGLLTAATNDWNYTIMESDDLSDPSSWAALESLTESVSGEQLVKEWQTDKSAAFYQVEAAPKFLE